METPPSIVKEPTEAVRGARRSGLRRTMIRLAAVPFLILLTAIIALHLYSISKTRKLERLRESIRAGGYPVTVEELSAWYSPGPGSEDTGLAFMELFSHYNAELHDEEDLLLFGAYPEIHEPLTDAQLELASSQLQNNADFLKKLHLLLLDNNTVRYPIDFTAGTETDFFNLPGVRTSTHLMALEAFFAAEAGDEERAIDALVDTFRVAETLRDEPSIIPQLMRVACLGIAFYSTEQVINRIELTGAEFVRLRETLDAIVCDGLVQLGHIGDRCLLYSSLNHEFGDLQKLAGLTDWEWSTSFERIFRLADWELLGILEYYTELIAVGDVEPFERRELVRNIVQRVEDGFGYGYFASKNLAPDVERAFETELRSIVHIDLLSVGLASLQFSNDHNRMPSDLQELVPDYISEVPTDPFSGEPLLMRSDETGFVVYSLGHDRDDDGGNPPPDGEKITDDGDIVFRILQRAG